MEDSESKLVLGYRTFLTYFFYSAATLLIFSVGIFAAVSTPISDDYCFALGASTGNIIKNSIYLTQNWSFLPIGYLIQNSIWLTSNSGSLASLFVTSLGFIAFLLSLIFLTRKFLFRQNIKVVVLLLGAFFTSILISRSGVIFKYSNLSEISISRFPGELFASLPDGRMAYWYFNTPLITGRTLIVSLIILIAVLFSKSYKRPSIKWVGLALFISLQAISESLFIAGALLMYLSFQLIRKAKVSPNLILCAVVFILVPILQTLTTGSQYRQGLLPESSISQMALKSILIFVYLVFTIYLMNTLIFATIGAVLVAQFKINIDYTVSRILRNIFALLAVSSFIIESLTSSFSYVAEYHWTTLHAFSFLAQFFAVLCYLQNKKAPSRSHSFAKPLLTLALSYSLVVSYQNIELSKMRLDTWNARSLESRAVQQNLRISIPRLDLNNRILVEDLEPNYMTIVSGRGYIKDAAFECYKKLPLGW
jgi:hypothetical protein